MAERKDNIKLLESQWKELCYKVLQKSGELYGNYEKGCLVEWWSERGCRWKGNASKMMIAAKSEEVYCTFRIEKTKAATNVLIERKMFSNWMKKAKHKSLQLKESN